MMMPVDSIKAHPKLSAQRRNGAKPAKPGPSAHPLVASEPDYRVLVERLPGVVYLLANDECQTPIYFSPRLADLTGYRPQDVVRRVGEWRWLDHVHPEDRARVAAPDTRAEETAEPLRREYRLRRADGSYVWVQDERVPVRDEAGQIVAWQGLLLDISDRIEMEEDQARSAAIVESAEDAIVSRTLDGTITSWNRGAERLYGYRAEEIVGKPFSLLIPEGVTEHSLVPVEALGDQPVRFEATRRRKDGTTVEVAISVSPIRDRNGVIVGAASITRDITDRKRAEAELRTALEEAHTATRAKTMFLAMLSHELRTPLQAILGYSDFLLSGPSGSLTPEQAEDIGFIQQGARRMVSLIDQMLDLARMEAGRLELHSERVDLAEIIEQVRQDVAPQAAAKGLQLAISLPKTLPAALGDAVRIRQILVNLVGNAVKFTDEGGVRISARATAEGIDVAVSDTGIGIAPEALPHIFEEFRQLENRANRRYGGAGLGLAISRRLAEQMGGGITVESAPNVGSTFTLHLPAAKPLPNKTGKRSRSKAHTRSAG